MSERKKKKKKKKEEEEEAGHFATSLLYSGEGASEGS
jgi:hypothetical protein